MICNKCKVRLNSDNKSSRRLRCKKCISEYMKEYNHRRGKSKKYAGPNKELVGQKFNYWTVISFKLENNHHYYLCQCDCGFQKYDIASNILREKSKSCGCKNPKGEASKLWGGHGEISGNYWNQIKSKKRRRNVKEFSITIEYIWELFLKQNRKCKLTNIELNMGNCTNKDNRTASLDRIDPSKGYIEGNVQWVHKDINWMKNTFDQEYFIKMCKKVADNNK